MVKGVSRQVIVVQSPEPKLFEQAIFFLRADALGDGVTEDHLMEEARQILRSQKEKRSRGIVRGILWAISGAACTAAAWVCTLILR